MTASSPRRSCSTDRQQSVLVDHGPAVVLGVGELEPLRAQLERQVEHLLDSVEVLSVQDAVDRQREVELPRCARRRDLLLERPVARNPVVLLGIGTLDRDLHVIEPGRLQLSRALAREQGAGGDQRRVQTRLPRGRAQLVQIAAQHRLAAGQGQLDDPQLARLAERADPVAGLELVAVRIPADVDRVRAVRAVQRALIGQLGDQRERPRRAASTRSPLSVIASTRPRTSSLTSAPS